MRALRSAIDVTELRRRITRREALGAAVTVVIASAVDGAPDEPAEPIIDIHQHTNYSGRTDEQLLRHQRAMGVSRTILLPAGSPVDRPSTHHGKSNGLAAGCGGNDTCIRIAREHPDEYLFFVNEVPDLPGARDTLAKYLRMGGLGIGEQKFSLPCDSPPIEMVAEVAGEFGVPVLMHFQHGMYNLGFENFHKTLEKFPNVKFIGHAQTFWAYTDAKCDPTKMYPGGKVTPGGLTDRYLADYPNMLADISAGSGLNFLNRDESHAREFLDRHQDKILFGSDCNDRVGRGPTCQGWLTIRAVRRLATSKAVERKILYENARKLFRL